MQCTPFSSWMRATEIEKGGQRLLPSECMAILNWRKYERLSSSQLKTCCLYRTYALTSSRRHVGGQSHCLVHACATGTFLTTAFTHNPIDPQAAAHFCFFDGVTSYA